MFIAVMLKAMNWKQNIEQGDTMICRYVANIMFVF